MRLVLQRRVGITMKTWNVCGILLLQTTLGLLLVRSDAQNVTMAGGDQVVESACTHSADQSTTILTTDIKYEYQFLLTASLFNVQYESTLADPDSTLFRSTASAFEDEITGKLWPLIQNPPPSMVPVALDAVVIQFRPYLGQAGGLTLECVLSTDTDQITTSFLSSQLQTVTSRSTAYPNFTFRLSASVNYCLREVLLTQVGTVTWPLTPVGTETGTEELCPVGTKYVGERFLGRRSCSRAPDPPGHAQWEPYTCLDCGKILQVDDALEAIYNEIRQNSSIVLDGVTRAGLVLNEVTDITEVGFDWVALIVQYVAGLNLISTELLDAVMRLLSNLLQQDAETFRQAEQQSGSSTSIVQSLAVILKGTILTNSALEYASIHPNIASSLLDVPQSQIQDEWISFGSVVSPIADAPLNEGSVGLLTGRSLSLLPNSEAYVHIKVEGPVSTDRALVRTVFVVYRNAKLFQSLNSAVSMTSEVAGRVVSADIRATQSPQLSIITRFKPLDPGVTNVECRSWNPSLSNGHGDWSTPACMLDEKETSGRVKCQCDGLTAFTIFADPSPDDPDASSGVNAFVRVGAVICMLCLLAAAIMYLVVKELRTRLEMQILSCLFLVLAAFYLILTAGIDQSGPGCIFVGALLHYCLLAAVGWMGIAWVHLYDLSRRKQWVLTWFMVKVSGPVWGIPLLFVIITVVVDPNHYITPSQRCFLSSEPIYNLVAALLLPIILILIAMGVAFGFTAHNVILDSEALPDEDPEGRVGQGPSKLSKFWKTWQKYILYSAVIMLTILTLIFFIVMVNNDSDVAEYIFGFLAIVKGILIVVVFCIYRQDVRETMLIKLGYLNGPEGQKFQPYWSTAKWQRKNQRSVLPEAVEEEEEDKQKNLYLDDTQGSSAQTNQGFDPTTIPLSTIEMQRMGPNGVISHTNGGMVVEADYHDPPAEAEARV